MASTTTILPPASVVLPPVTVRYDQISPAISNPNATALLPAMSTTTTYLTTPPPPITVHDIFIPDWRSSLGVQGYVPTTTTTTTTYWPGCEGPDNYPYGPRPSAVSAPEPWWERRLRSRSGETGGEAFGAEDSATDDEDEENRPSPRYQSTSHQSKKGDKPAARSRSHTPRYDMVPRSSDGLPVHITYPEQSPVSVPPISPRGPYPPPQQQQLGYYQKPWNPAATMQPMVAVEPYPYIDTSLAMPPSASPTATGAEQYPRHSILYAWQITRVIPGSPAQLAGIIPFFDFMVEMDGHRMGPDYNTVLAYIRDHFGRPITWRLYNSKTRTVRDALMVPNGSNSGGGLIGCSVRWVNVNEAFTSAREIVEVIPGSNAQKAGMAPYRDWIIGMQDPASPSDAPYTTVFADGSDFEQRVQFFRTQSFSAKGIALLGVGHHFLILKVYDRMENVIHELFVAMPFGVGAPTGTSRSIAPGATIPLLRTVLSTQPNASYDQSVTRLMSQTRSVAGSQTDGGAGAATLPPVVTYPQPAIQPEPAFLLRTGHRLRQYMKVRYSFFLRCTFLTVIASLTVAIYHFVLYAETVGKPCKNPLGAWALVHAINMIVLPLYEVVLIALISGRLHTNDIMTFLGGAFVIGYSLWFLAWWLVGNSWTFAIDVEDCDRWLYHSCFWWIIVQYIFAFVVCLFLALRRVELREEKNQYGIDHAKRETLGLPYTPAGTQSSSSTEPTTSVGPVATQAQPIATMHDEFDAPVFPAYRFSSSLANAAPSNTTTTTATAMANTAIPFPTTSAAGPSTSTAGLGASSSAS